MKKKNLGEKENGCVERKLMILMKLGKYKHYKGKIVEVIGVGKHSETLEKLVIYKEGKNLWVRPEEMFKEKTIINGKKISRFKKINI